MAEFKNIPVHSTTKAKLDLIKGNDSYNDFFVSVLTFQEATGTDFKKIQAYPSLIMIKDLERVIKIIKNIEKSKLDPILEMVQDLQLNVENRDGGPPAAAGRMPTAEEVDKVVTKNERLQGELKEAQKKAADLEQQNAQLKNQLPAEGNFVTGINVSEIRKLLQRLEGGATQDRFNTNHRMVKVEVLAEVLDGIRKCINLG